MRQAKKTIISASIFMALSMAAAGSTSAWAQGDEAQQEGVEAESFADEDSGEAVFTEEAGSAEACPEGETCTDEAETPTETSVSDDAGLAAPAPGADTETNSSDTPVLASPGSTGNDGGGGGTSRPGTTPDT